MVKTVDAAGLPCLETEEAVGRVYRVLGPELDLEDSGKGAAFLLDEFHLVTCAHVVAVAVGKGLKDGTWLKAELDRGTTVRVQEANPYAEPFEAVVKFYKPHDSPDFTADIAILELEADQSLATPFSPNAPEHGTALRAFGFPAGHKKTGGWVDVTTNGYDALGWLQVEKKILNGVPVKGGISGTPVWLGDLSGVVGMITMADEKTGVAHIIPYERIRKAAEAIRRVPRLASSDREVVESLLTLDFEPQMSVAARIAGEKRAALLVHGDDDHGQRMLLERIRRTNKLDNTFFFKVDLGRVTLRPDTAKIYLDVAKWLEINPPERAISEPELIHRAIAKRLKLKDTVIIFLPHVQTPKEVINEIIGGFWQPLIKSLQNVPAANKRLMLLILDEYACRKQWGQLDVAQTFKDWRQEVPLELPALSPIEKATLEDWLIEAATPMVDVATRSLIAELLYEQSNNGIPEWVFHHYCKMRALSWSEVRHRWLER
jgi:inactive STAND/Trypsin-like peptidase domain